MFVSYVELHCHSAFSFLDGASLPDELAAAALELGHTALALTDHDSVSGSMEFAQAARGARGLRAIHGAEVRSSTTDGTRHLTLLVRDARGWRNLCRLLTRAHAHTRDDARRGATAALARRAVARCDDASTSSHAEGLVCLSGCARQGVHDEPTLRRLLARLRPRRASGSSCSGPSTATTARATAASRRSPTGSACPAWRPATSTRTRAPRAPLQDAFVALREHTTLDASEPLRRGNHSHVLASPEAMAARFADHPEAVAETARLAEHAALRPHAATSATATPAPRTPSADRKLAELCHALLRGPLPDAADRCAPRRAARLEEELRVIDALGLAGFFLLHRDMLELAREVAVEVRGPRHRPRAAAARPRARLLGVLDRLLPHRPLARRPDRQRAAASGASSTRSSRRCRTSTSTSRATCARC